MASKARNQPHIIMFVTCSYRNPVEDKIRVIDI